MEIERPPSLTAKKLWSIATIFFHVLKKGFTKRKILADLHILIKRWKIAGNAMKQIMHHLHQDYSTLACRNSTGVRMSIVPHRHEYEFSCSNSPTYSSYFGRKQQHYHYRPEHADFVQKVFDVFNKYDVVDASPLIQLPGFGHSPIVRQLRVTESPFPVKDGNENPQIDNDARNLF